MMQINARQLRQIGEVKLDPTLGVELVAEDGNHYVAQEDIVSGKIHWISIRGAKVFKSKKADYSFNDDLELLLEDLFMDVLFFDLSEEEQTSRVRLFLKETLKCYFNRNN